MRLIFVDEAGTSAREPITLVVGIIADADEHIVRAETILEDLTSSVPRAMRSRFSFHATEIWGSRALDPEWAFEDRVNLLKALMSIPRRTQMAVAMGMVRRDSEVPDGIAHRLSNAQFQHILAFSGCLARADKFVRQHARPNELATVVAEDVPEMRRFLSGVPDFLRQTGMSINPEDTIPTQDEIATGVRTQDGIFTVERIRSGIHFSAKRGDAMLQIADACAFGLRRFFGRMRGGEDFAQAIVGYIPDLRDYEGPSSYGSWRWSEAPIGRPVPRG